MTASLLKKETYFQSTIATSVAKTYSLLMTAVSQSTFAKHRGKLLKTSFKRSKAVDLLLAEKSLQ